MKIIISENQELDVKKKFIFILLNSMNYDLKHSNGYVIFNRVGHEYEIAYRENDKVCFISNRIILLLFSYTNFNSKTIKDVLVEWIEYVIQKKVDYTIVIFP